MERMTAGFLDEVKEKGKHIVDILSKLPGVYDISGLGMMLGFKVKGKESIDVVKAAMADGLLMLTAKDKVRLLPPLAISYEELDKGLEILKKHI